MKRERIFRSLKRFLNALTILSLALSFIFSHGIQPVSAQNPTLWVNPGGRWIQGHDWPLNTNITLTMTRSGVAYYTYVAQMAQAFWDPDNPDNVLVLYNLPEYVTILPGDLVTLTDGSTTKELVVSPLAVNRYLLDEDQIGGTATEAAAVQVCVNDPIGRVCRSVLAGPFGWLADFTSYTNPPDDPFNVDIHLESSGNAVETDADGDQTWADWFINMPLIWASTDSNWITGHRWELGTWLNLEITGPGTELWGGHVYLSTTNVQSPQEPNNPNNTYANFEIPPNFQVQAGQTITATGNVGGSTLVKTLLVSPVKVTSFDLTNDIVSGVGTAGMQVQICANKVEGGCVERFVIADGGSWAADYHTPGDPPSSPDLFDLQLGSNGWARETDLDQDSTWGHWNVPNPFIEASLTGGWIRAQGWPVGTDLTLVITDGSTQMYHTGSAISEQAPWNPNDSVAFFPDPSIELQEGMQLTVYGSIGGSSVIKNLWITPLAVTSINLNDDTVGGTASDGTQVQVCANTPYNCVSRTIEAISGAWTANYAIAGVEPDSPEIFDLTFGSNGWINARDPDADILSLEWSVPSPYVEASASSRWVHARGWATGTPVEMIIEENGIQIHSDNGVVGQAPWNPGDPNDIAADFPLPDWLQIKPGQIIRITGNVYNTPVTKELTVSDLHITEFDLENDRVSGVATIGAQVGVCANQPNYCSYRSVTPSEVDGSWTADYKVGDQPVDLIGGSNGWAHEMDADGDQTWADWNIPNPMFTVRHNTDQVEAGGWAVGSTLTLTVQGRTFNAVVGPAHWDPNQSYVNFSLQGQVDIQPGDFVTLSDGEITKAHTVTSLIVTETDTDLDQVRGTAAPGSQVDVWSCNNSGCVNRTAYANLSGDWMVDFAHPGDYDSRTMDLAPGISGDSAQRDEDGDQTQWNWWVSTPRLDASYEFDWIGANDFTPNGQITYEIYNEQGGLVFGPVTGPLDGNGNGWISTQLTHTSLAPGFRVFARDETTGAERNLVIQKLVFEQLDEATNFVKGQADPGATVSVNIGPYNFSDANINVQLVTDESGVWQADLATMGFDVKSYWWASANICDENNNCTNAEAPKLHAQPRSNSLGFDNFSKYTEVTLNIYDDGGNLIFGPQQMFTNANGQGWINLGDFNFQLVVGQKIVVSDPAGWSKDLTIGYVTFDNLDPDNDTTRGRTEANGQLSVHVNNMFNNWGDRLSADLDGNWSYDFGARGYDLTENMWGSIWLQDTSMDFTEDFLTTAPNVTVSAQWDWISGWNLSPNGPVIVQIFAENGNLLKEETYTANGNTGLWLDSGNTLIDMVPGMRVVLQDVLSGYNAEVVIQAITFDSVDFDNNITTGTADPFTRVVVTAGSQFDSYQLATTADENGVWRADFGTLGVTLRPDMWYNAQIFDDEGDSTQGEPPPPPTISASEDDNWIQGNNWPPDSEVIITIRTSPQVGSLAIFTMGLLAEPTAGEDTITITVLTDRFGNFFVNLWDYGVLLKTGDTVTVTDTTGAQVKEQEIISLAITQIDYETDIVYGVAPVGTRVTVGFGNNDRYHEFDVFAGEDGQWVANFGVYEFDLTTDMNGNVRASDEDGDTTNSYFNPPNFTVWPLEDYVEGWNYKEGSTVTLTVDDPANGEGLDYTNSTVVSPAPWDPNNISARFETWNEANHPDGATIDILPGFTLTMSDGFFTKTHVVTNLALDEQPVNNMEDTLSGTADPGSQVHGWICGSGPGCGDSYATADSSGHWVLDFTGSYDFHTQGWGEVQQSDPDGDATQLRWQTNTAPQITAIIGPLDPKSVGTLVTLSAEFFDPDEGDQFNAEWDWGDGTTSAGTITGQAVDDTHLYNAPGVYQVVLTISDDKGGSDSATYQYVVIYDPNGGFVTGGGWILSPEGAYLNNPTLIGKATFGFVAKYLKGAKVPTGTTQFVFHIANFTFESTAYDWLVVAGTKAQYKGTGTINGEGQYRFILTAVDGSPDRFRIKIWDLASGEVIYDNQRAAEDSASDATALGGGSITIHKGK